MNLVPRFRASRFIALHLATLLLTLAGSSARAANCANIGVGLAPLNDLGPGSYDGFTGGLYPGGQNTRPFFHDMAGLSQALQVTPRDTSGIPDPNGTILFISIGLSNTSQDWMSFMDSAQVDPLRSPRVRLMDCAVGGWDACQISDPAAGYWPIIDTRIRNQGYRPPQVQAVWLMTVCRSDSLTPCLPDTFPCDALKGKAQLRSIVRNLHDIFPNLKLVYVSSRNYGGYSAFGNNGERWSYHHGFSVKWLIEDQLQGDADLNWNAAAGPVQAPWLSWGPYLWADGLTPRSDGLTWECADFVSDGVHPSPQGRGKAASKLLQFVHTDPTVVPWYTGTTATVIEGSVGRPADAALRAWPNPFEDRIQLAPAAGVDRPVEGARIRIFDAQGRLIRSLPDAGEIASFPVEWNGRDEAGVAAPPGIYFVRLRRGGEVVTRKIVRR